MPTTALLVPTISTARVHGGDCNSGRRVGSLSLIQQPAVAFNRHPLVDLPVFNPIKADILIMPLLLGRADQLQARTGLASSDDGLSGWATTPPQRLPRRAEVEDQQDDISRRTSSISGSTSRAVVAEPAAQLERLVEARLGELARGRATMSYQPSSASAVATP